MRFVVDVLHPIDSHFFHYFIDEMSRRGHEFIVTSRDKECAVELLDAFGIEHTMLTRRQYGLVRKVGELAVRVRGMVKLAKEFDPDYLLSMTGPVIALAGQFMRAKPLVFHDNEDPRLLNRTICRLSDLYAVPQSFRDDVGRNMVRYPGYQQLAYLHPNWFTPNLDVVRKHGLLEDRPLYIVRFVLHDAYHDVGEHGLTMDDKRHIVKMLSEKGRVVITSEEDLPDEFKPYQLAIPYEDIHHVMAYAELLVGESCSMAAEASVLGTHAFYIATTQYGWVDDIEERYGLAHSYKDDQAALAIKNIEAMMARDDLKADAQERAARLTAEQCDLTQWMIDYIEKDSGVKL